MLDTVEITIPRERDFSIVAELVIGGIAARHDLRRGARRPPARARLAARARRGRRRRDQRPPPCRQRAIDVSVGPVGERTVAELEREPARHSACAGCSTRPSTTRAFASATAALGRPAQGIPAGSRRHDARLRQGAAAPLPRGGRSRRARAADRAVPRRPLAWPAATPTAASSSTTSSRSAASA